MSNHSNQTVHAVEVDVLNYFNIFLMVVSVVIAAYVPFETFLIAYAVLGPLHYLTEISWLHDRGYFTNGSRDWIWLVLATVVMSLGFIVPVGALPDVTIFSVGFTFVVSAGMVFATTTISRTLFVLMGAVVGGLALTWEPFSGLIAVLLPTLIHVYVFTGFFILYGALKGRSFSGILSLIVFLSAPFVCLYGLNTPSGYQPSEYLLNSATPFNGLGDMVIGFFGLPADREGDLAFMRLMGFAYSYHYLNWFSKTRIINWHKVSRARIGLIGFVYVAAVGLFAIHYQLGFIVLLTLSLGHVVLEFPLNFKTIASLIGDGLKGVRKRA